MSYRAAGQMDAEMEEEEDDLIGPAPPELVDELENAGSDDRSKEVIRILRCCLVTQYTSLLIPSIPLQPR